MAIVIDDKQTVDLIRKIGQRTGETPAKIVGRLVEAEINRAPQIEGPAAEFMQVLHDLNRKYAPAPQNRPNPEESRRIQSELFDYLEGPAA